MADRALQLTLFRAELDVHDEQTSEHAGPKSDAPSDFA